MKNLFYSFVIPVFLIAALLHTNTTPDPATASSKKLARQMTKLLGVKIKPGKANVYPVRKIHSWIGVPSFLVDKLKKQEYTDFIFVEFQFHEDVKEITMRIPESIREKFGADFIIAVNQDANADEQDTKLTRCIANRCDLAGKCRSSEFLIEGTNCKDMCSSDSECQEPCFIGMCENGLCMPSVIYADDCSSIEDMCKTMDDCPATGTDTTCEQKICLATGHCWEVSFEINSGEKECPKDECQNDEECIGFGEGENGILDGIKEIYGY